MENPFKGIGSAPPSLGGAYILPGLHKLEVKECKLVNSQQKQTLVFVVSTTVIESDNDAMKLGSERSWVVLFSWPSHLSNIRQFIEAATGFDFEKLSDEEAAELSAGVVDESNPLKGQILHCNAFNLKTRADKDFTKCVWEAAEEEDAAA